MEYTFLLVLLFIAFVILCGGINEEWKKSDEINTKIDDLENKIIEMTERMMKNESERI